MLTIHHRPSCCRGRGLLLAQDLLGLVDDKSGSRRQADPDTAVGQPGHGLHHAGLGVAAGVPRRLGLPPQPRDPPRHPAARHAGLRPAVPGKQRGYVLRGRHDHLLLGIQRGRGKHQTPFWALRGSTRETNRSPDHRCQAVDAAATRLKTSRRQGLKRPRPTDQKRHIATMSASARRTLGRPYIQPSRDLLF